MAARDKIEEIAILLTKLAKRHKGLRLQVDEKGLRQEGDWVYLPVVASGTVPSSGILYDLYANAEIESEEKLGTKLMIVPTTLKKPQKKKPSQAAKTKKRSA